MARLAQRLDWTRRGWTRSGWPGWRAIALSAGLGVIAASGQAPFGAWWLALPALAALIHIVSRAASAKAAAWTAWFGGAGYFAAALSWIVQPFLVDAATYGWMAPFALLFLAFGLALFWAVAAGLAYRVANRAYGFAITLTAAELLRGYVLTGFPWALIGHIWIETPVAQLAAWIGPSGLTLISLFVAALAAQGFTQRKLAPVGTAAALVLVSWAYGLWVLAQPMPTGTGATLRLVQPNAAQQAKWDPDLAQQFFDRLLAFTAVKPAPDLVIWPETALPYLLSRHPEIGTLIADAAHGVPVAIGMQRVVGNQGWNTLAIIGTDGRVQASYDKHHLVPFGEYIPYGDLAYRLFGVSAFAAQQGNGYTPGPGPKLLDFGVKLGMALPLICYEAVFPQDLRGTPRADWILQITNDAWFGTLTGPFQHADQARLRAIEQGLPLVRVANTGVTAVYDARGRTTAQLDFGIASYLDADLPGALPATPYAKYGEFPVLVWLGGLGVWLFRRKARPAA